MEIYRSESLLNRCVESVVAQLSHHEGQFVLLPANIKDRVLHLMSKRGTISDKNIHEVLHDKVRMLDLSECDISDAALHTIASKCPLLRKLDLNSTKVARTSITSQGVKSLAQGCRNLQVVYLRRCANIDDEAVIALAQCCPLMRELNIGSCTRVTNNSLETLGQNSAHLRSINISHSGVTDDGITSLVMGVAGRGLKELHIAGCTHLSDEAVEAVMQFCPNINILLFHGCPKITDRSREAMEEMQSPMKQVTWTIY